MTDRQTDGKTAMKSNNSPPHHQISLVGDYQMAYLLIYERGNGGRTKISNGVNSIFLFTNLLQKIDCLLL